MVARALAAARVADPAGKDNQKVVMLRPRRKAAQAVARPAVVNHKIARYLT
jgi:hypothetical protein